MLVAAIPGRISAVAQAVQDAGGFVLYRADKVVTAHSLPSKVARVDYAEAVVVPKYGELTVTDTSSRRAAGATWTAEVRTSGGEAVPENRARMAVVDVVSEMAQTPVGSFWGQPGPDTPLGPSVFGTVWLPLPPPVEKSAAGGK